MGIWCSRNIKVSEILENEIDNSTKISQIRRENIKFYKNRKNFISNFLINFQIMGAKIYFWPYYIFILT